MSKKTKVKKATIKIVKQTKDKKAYITEFGNKVSNIELAKNASEYYTLDPKKPLEDVHWKGKEFPRAQPKTKPLRKLEVQGKETSNTHSRKKCLKKSSTRKK